MLERIIDSEESHQRSWWIVHTQPTNGAARRLCFPESHQRSWWIVHTQPTAALPAAVLQNPTNAVGGSFTLSLQRRCRRPFSRIPPTQLVDFILSLHSGSPSGVLNPTNAVGG